MPNYVVNGLFKRLAPNPKSTIGLSLFKKILKRDLDELNVPYADACCLSDVTRFPVVLNIATGNLEAIDPDTNEYVQFQINQSEFTTGNDIAAGTGGAISLTSYYTSINTDADGDAFTLAAGTVKGQRKRIRLVVDGGGDGVVTVTSLSGGTTITFNDAGDDVELFWNGTNWIIIVNIGATVA